MVVLLKLLLTVTTTFIKLNITPTGEKVSFLKEEEKRSFFFFLTDSERTRTPSGFFTTSLPPSLSVMIGMMFSLQFAVHSNMLG